MSYRNKRRAEGFAALMSVLVLSAVFSLILYIRTERLAALSDEFFNAVRGVRSNSATLSCEAVNQFIQTTKPSFIADGSLFSVDFSSSTPLVVASVSAIATSCSILTTTNN